jgi:glycosyltransferase involved in cell wall biosynthesis
LIQICHEIEQRDAQPGKWDRFVAEPLLRACYRNFSAVILLAHTVQTEFRARYGHDHVTVVLPHGPQLLFPDKDAPQVPYRSRYGIEPGERVVLFFGLLRPSKGVSDLVEAFARIGDANKVRLVIAGFPTKAFDTDALGEQINHLGLTDRISLFPDYVPLEDVGALLRLADVVVFPYRNATASGAAAAAQSLGRPVVVTSVGGLSETVRDGETGLVVPPCDPAALAQAITKTLADRNQATRMGAAGREEILSERSWEAFAKRILELFEKQRV